MSKSVEASNPSTQRKYTRECPSRRRKKYKKKPLKLITNKGAKNVDVQVKREKKEKKEKRKRI
jgi:hypothetical protein